MKKRSLIFGIAVLVSAALIFSGCETETETTTETVTVNNGAAADLGGLQELLATEGLNEVAYYGTLEIGAETLLIPAGKTVTMKDGGVTLSTGLLVVAGTLTLPEAEKIVVTATGTDKGTVAGPDALLDSVEGSNAVKAKLADSIADVAADTAVALENFALPASYTNFAGTAYVYGTLTVSATSTAPTSGKIVAIGNVSLGATTTVLSDENKVDVSKATLVTSAAATVTLPATATVAAIDATEGVFTVAGAATSLTVTKLTGTLALPAALAAVTISGGTGNITAPAIAISGDAEFGNTGTVTFSATATFSGDVEFGGDVVLTAAKAFTLAKDKKLTLADGKSVKVDEDVILTAGGETVLTAKGSQDASTLTPAEDKLTLGGEALEITSGALSVAEDAELALGKKLTVAAGAELAIAGTVTAGTDGLVLTSAADSGGAKLSGAGKVVAAKTEITGVWQAVGASGTVTIAATDADESSITASADTAVLTAGTGGTITQGTGEDNNLKIAANTTIDLKGTIAAPTAVGVIKLAESTTADQGGKLTLSTATSVIKVGSETDGSALSAAVGDFVTTAATGKITISDIANVSILPGDTTTTKVNTIKGGTASGTLQAFGGSGGTGAVEIKAGTAVT
jgi:hypothetical protein